MNNNCQDATDGKSQDGPGLILARIFGSKTIGRKIDDDRAHRRSEHCHRNGKERKVIPGGDTEDTSEQEFVHQGGK